MATKQRHCSWPVTQKPVEVRKRNQSCSSYMMLLSSIANDLDLMLNDLCKTFPYPASVKSPGLMRNVTRNCDDFEHHMGLLEEEDGSSSMESLDERHPAYINAAIFHVDDLDLDSESGGSDTPICDPLPLTHQGYLRRTGEHESISTLERLVRTHPVWYLPNIGRAGAVNLLQQQQLGAFLVRQSSKKDTMALSVRQSGQPSIEHYLIEVSGQGLRLEGSFHHFSAMPLLVAYYAENLDELPLRLVLPPAITRARSLQELTSLALLGQDFWTSTLIQSKNRTYRSKKMPLYTVNHVTNRPTSQSSDAASFSSEDNTGKQSPFQMLSDLDLLVHENIEELKNNQQNIITSSKHATTQFSHSTDNHTHNILNGFSKTTTVNSFTSEQLSQKSILNQKLLMHEINISSQTEVISDKTGILHKDIEKQFNSQPQTPVKIASPVSNGKAWTPKTPYFVGNLADRLSDYEDIWNTPKATPAAVESKQRFLYVQNPSFDSQSNMTSTRTSVSNAGYQSDEDSLSSRDPSMYDSDDSKDPVFIMKNESLKEVSSNNKKEETFAIATTTPENTGTVIRQHKLKDNTHVFSFDFFLPPSPPDFGADNLVSAAATRPVSPPLATSTANRSSASASLPPFTADAFSSPNYAQPNESRPSEGPLASMNLNTIDNVNETDLLMGLCNSPSPNQKTPPPIPARKYKSPTCEISETANAIFDHQLIESTNHIDNVVSSEPILMIAPQPLQQRPPPSPTPPPERRKRSAKKYGSKSQSFRAAAPGVIAVRQLDSNKCRSLPSTIERSRRSSDKLMKNLSTSSKLCMRMNQEGVCLRQSPRTTPERCPLINDHSDVARTGSRVASLPGSTSRPQSNEVTNRESKLSDSYEDDYYSVNEEPVVEERTSSPKPLKFPVTADLRRMSFSDTSTVEDLISDISPDLTVKPIKPLTLRNLQRMSDYDNIGGSFRPASSTGTEFCKPWDSSVWKNLLAMGGEMVQPQQQTVSDATPTPPVPMTTLSPEFSRTLQQWKDNNKDINLEEADSEEPDYSSIYVESHQGEVKTVHHTLDLGCDIAGSFEWHRPDLMFRNSPPKEVSVRRTTDGAQVPPPPPRDMSSQTSIPTCHIQPSQPVAMTTPAERPRLEPPSYQRDTLFSDDDDNMVDEELISESFKDRLMPFLGSSRLLNLRKNKVNNPVVKVRDFVTRMSSSNSTTFGIYIQNFIKCTQEGAEQNPHVVMRNVRQFMNGIKNYLVKHGEHELNILIEEERNKLESDEFLNIDAIIENALHRCVIKPLKQHIYKLFVDEYSRKGYLKQLSENIKYARTKTPEDMGIKPELIPPQGTSLEVIKHFLSKMQRAYSPLKKLENLLGATSSIYNSVEGMANTKSKRGDVVSIGADDFLPIVIYVLVHSGVVAAEIEADYMWGLLHPSLLAGEGGYYLTTLSSAVHVLKNFRETFETQPITSEAHLPSLADMQGFMKIMIPDEKCDSIITKTLPVRPNMPARDVCSMIAHRFKITNPQDYGLYEIVNGIETKLANTQCPQNMKAEKTSAGQEVFFTYKRNNARFIWPVSMKS